MGKNQTLKGNNLVKEVIEYLGDVTGVLVVGVDKKGANLVELDGVGRIVAVDTWWDRAAVGMGKEQIKTKAELVSEIPADFKYNLAIVNKGSAAKVIKDCEGIVIVTNSNDELPKDAEYYSGGGAVVFVREETVTNVTDKYSGRWVSVPSTTTTASRKST